MVGALNIDNTQCERRCTHASILPSFRYIYTRGLAALGCCPRKNRRNVGFLLYLKLADFSGRLRSLSLPLSSSPLLLLLQFSRKARLCERKQAEEGEKETRAHKIRQIAVPLKVQTARRRIFIASRRKIAEGYIFLFSPLFFFFFCEGEKSAVDTTRRGEFTSFRRGGSKALAACCVCL